MPVMAGDVAPPAAPPTAVPPGTYAASPPVPPQAAPLAYPSPPPPPAGYLTPYYVPGAGSAQAPVHRVPLTLIISAVVVLVLLMAGIGTAIAIIGSNHNTQTGNGIAGGLPSPSPEGTPSAVGSPVSAQTTTASNSGETVPVPAGWSVSQPNGETISLIDPSSEGEITVASGLSNPAQSAQQLHDSIDKNLAARYPDVTNCPSGQTKPGTLNGASGLVWTLCFTLTSGGQSLAAVSSLFVGASSSGGVFYLVELVTIQDNLQSFVDEAKPILAGITWKLA